MSRVSKLFCDVVSGYWRSAATATDVTVTNTSTQQKQVRSLDSLVGYVDIWNTIACYFPQRLIYLPNNTTAVAFASLQKLIVARIAGQGGINNNNNNANDKRELLFMHEEQSINNNYNTPATMNINFDFIASFARNYQSLIHNHNNNTKQQQQQQQQQQCQQMNVYEICLTFPEYAHINIFMSRDDIYPSFDQCVFMSDVKKIYRSCRHSESELDQNENENVSESEKIHRIIPGRVKVYLPPRTQITQQSATATTSDPESLLWKLSVSMQKDSAGVVEHYNENAYGHGHVLCCHAYRITAKPALKVLLLGTADSGKSTFFKQLRRIYVDNVSNGQKQQSPQSRPINMRYAGVIHTQIMEAMQTSIKTATDAAATAEQPIWSSERASNAARSILADTDHTVTHEMAAHIKVLCREPAMKHRRGYPRPTSYFRDHIDRIAGDAYVPNDQDMLYARWRTTGIIETRLATEHNNFAVFDVGGMRGERRKWIHCFQNVSCVVFFVSLACYDEPLFEDSATNQMAESLALFANVCNQTWFADTPIYLMLNKTDLLKAKMNGYSVLQSATTTATAALAGVPITDCPSFASYAGDITNYKDCVRYIRTRFESLLNADANANGKETAQTKIVSRAIRTIEEIDVSTLFEELDVRLL